MVSRSGESTPNFATSPRENPGGGADDRIYQTVNMKGGRVEYAENVLLDTDHRGLNKFPSAKDPNFRKFFSHFKASFHPERVGG